MDICPIFQKVQNTFYTACDFSIKNLSKLQHYYTLKRVISIHCQYARISSKIKIINYHATYLLLDSAYLTKKRAVLNGDQELIETSCIRCRILTSRP